VRKGIAFYGKDALQIPSYRTQVAFERGVADKLLVKTWGGIGDQVCAEPTLRYILEAFKGCSVSLASEIPELFGHLKFAEVFDLRRVVPREDNYLVLNTINSPDSLTWEFIGHCVTHCVDFASLCAIRCQLPVSYRQVQMRPPAPGPAFFDSVFSAPLDQCIFIHPGAHWPSKTFPPDWWSEVVSQVVMRGLIPVIIGKDCDDNRTTVNFEVPPGAVDLRNKTSILETLWLLKNARALITNDSSPLHMAAAGRGHIAFVATAKHQDYIYHWREGGWAWRMKHFNSGGIWDLVDHCPNKENEVTVEFVAPEILVSWLPLPTEIANWAADMVAQPF